MAKYKIIYDREACIGALDCIEISKELWVLKDDYKVDLTGAKLNEETNKWELIVDEKNFNIAKASEEACPVLAIKVEKIED